MKRIVDRARMIIAETMTALGLCRALLSMGTWQCVNMDSSLGRQLSGTRWWREGVLALVDLT